MVIDTPPGLEGDSYLAALQDLVLASDLVLVPALPKGPTFIKVRDVAAAFARRGAVVAFVLNEADPRRVATAEAREHLREGGELCEVEIPPREDIHRTMLEGVSVVEDGRLGRNSRALVVRGGPRLMAARASPSRRSIVGAQPDRRVAALPVSAETTALGAEVRSALAGEAWAGDEAKVAKVAEEIGRLRRDAAAMQSRMLDVGRRLLRLTELAGEGGYKALHKAGLVPFSESMASKLRTVAAAVDGGRVPAEALPRAVDAAVLVARLDPPAAARLVEAGVVRPEATRREISEAVRSPKPGPADDGPLTAGERRLLERRAVRLRAELARIEARLGHG